MACAVEGGAGVAVAAGAGGAGVGVASCASSSPNGSLYWSSPAPWAKADDGARAIAVAATHRDADVDYLQTLERETPASIRFIEERGVEL